MRRRYNRRPNRKKQKSGGASSLLLVLIIIGIGVLWKMDKISMPKELSQVSGNKITEVKKTSTTPSVGMLRGNVAKLIAYTFYNTDEIERLAREIEIEDTLPSFWYDKYINAVVNLGYMEDENNKFYPTNFITYDEVVDVLDKISENKYHIEIESEEDIANKKVSMYRFMSVYKDLLEKLSEGSSLKEKYDMYEKNIIVLATPANEPSMGAWKVATDQGEYGFEGISLDGYLDKKIKVLVKNNEILGVMEILEDNPSFESAVVSKVENGQVEILIGGVTKTYKTDLIDATYKDMLVDLHFNNGNITSVDIKNEEYKDRVVRIVDGKMEMERAGILALSDDLKIYDMTDDSSKWSNLKSIIVGLSDIEYATENGKVQSITIRNKPDINKIRVLLTTTDFKDNYHESIQIKSSEPFVVDLYGEKKTYETGEIFDVKDWDKKLIADKPRLKVIPTNGAKLEVLNIERQKINPSYAGVLEICKEEKKKYTLINEVSMEDYVAGVIPSEMPTSYGLEACKVQAVTARSYAYIQTLNNKYRDYGANVDDSTNNQVYNNIQGDEISLKAATETKGKLLKYNGQVISANCFATSSGYTANYGEVWATSDGTFPANTPAYLVSKQQYLGDRQEIDMSDEETASKFFKKSSVGTEAYDSTSPWFRWQVTMSAEELSASVNAGIAKRYSVNPSLIKTLGNDRVFRPKEIDGIGVVEKIQVHKRGQGGNVMDMIIYGSKDTIKVSTEYNIRTLFSPLQRIEGREPIVIKRQDATEVKNFEMLPSAFFTLDAKYDKNEKLQSVTIYGGGFGHGVGMSQDGVRGMVEKGHDYLEILEHYYPGTKVSGVI